MPNLIADTAKTSINTCFIIRVFLRWERSGIPHYFDIRNKLKNFKCKVMSEQKTKTGTFHVIYLIESPVGTAPIIEFNLIVNTVSKRITGSATLRGPGIDADDEIRGEYHFQTTMPHKTSIMANLTGYAYFQPIGLPAPNLKASLLLTDDWQSGKAVYEYLENGHWVKVEGSVRKLEIATV